MSRVLVEIKIGDKRLNAVLDTGSRRSYIRSEFVEGFPKAPVQPFQVSLGGKTFDLKEGTLIFGTVADTDGREYRFSSILFSIEDLGEENGKRIDMLLGAGVLEDWGTIIDESVSPPRVDYSILRKGELVEL